MTPSHTQRAEIIAFPHSQLIEPRAADCLIANIATALEEVERETIERVARIFEGNEQTFSTDIDSVDFTYRVMAIISENIRSLLSPKPEKDDRSAERVASEPSN
jgi:hypothetical protein